MTKRIQRDRRFEKHFKKRVGRDKRLLTQFRGRLDMFITGERGYPLNDHALTGEMKGKRAFSITGDIRVIYEETNEYIIFLDIGTHNQVYL